MIEEDLFNYIRTRLANTKYAKLAFEVGNGVFLADVLLLFNFRFNFINLSEIPIFSALVNLQFWLWLYIIWVTLVVSPLIYLERRMRVSVDLCPACKVPFEKLISYKCPDCGGILGGERK
jgi:hypothetical protein